MRASGIYKITNIVTGDFYIGSAVYIKSRFARHRCNLRKRAKANDHLQNAWDKYGENNFTFEVVELCSKEILIEREQYYLDTLNPTYNICQIAGSTYGVKISEETKLKLREHFKGREPSNKGKQHSLEARQLQKEAWAKRKANGWRMPDETRARISQSMKKIRANENSANCNNL